MIQFCKAVRTVWAASRKTDTTTARATSSPAEVKNTGPWIVANRPCRFGVCIDTPLAAQDRLQAILTYTVISNSTKSFTPYVGRPRKPLLLPRQFRDGNTLGARSPWRPPDRTRAGVLASVSFPRTQFARLARASHHA